MQSNNRNQTRTRSFTLSNASILLAVWDRYTSDQHYTAQIIDAFENAVKLEPDEPAFRTDYGWYLHEIQQYAEAMPHFQKAVELDSSDADAINGCALCSAEMESDDTAQRYFQMALGNSPNDVDHHMEYVNFRLRKEVPDIDEARDYVEKVVKLDDEQKDWFYYQFAKLLRDYTKNWSESQKYYLKCFEVDDEYHGHAGSYPYLLYLMEDFDEAMKYVKIQFEVDERFKECNK